MSRFTPVLVISMASIAHGAWADENDPRWMLTAMGGAMSRDDDQTHGYGSVAVTRKLGSGYIGASITKFDSAVRQVDVTLPSTYTVGFLSAGGTRGPWFFDGYASLGRQHYKAVITDLGARAIRGSSHSPVYGAGADVGYVKWIGSTLSVTPSASLQWIRSRALREQVGPMGGSEYETRENGATLGTGLRIDKFFGPSRGRSVSLRVTHFQTTNASAALSSGTRGAFDPATKSARGSDGWIELGGSATWRATRRVYLDVGVSRTMGAAAGDLTAGFAGARVLF